MADVFISYKRDERTHIAQLADALRGLGVSVWFDASLSAGEAFSDEIDREARAAKSILVCWSPTARESRWVKAEAEIGFAGDKLAAAYVAGPDGFAAPVPFNTIHAEDLRAWLSAPDHTHSGWRSLLRRIGKLCGRSDIESWGALDAQATAVQLRQWLETHKQSPLFVTVDAMLTAREAQDAQRLRIDQEARARRAKEEAERRERERVDRERTEREVAARRAREDAEALERERRRARERDAAEEHDRRQRRAASQRKTRQVILSWALGGLLVTAALCWVNRETLRRWTAEQTDGEVRSLQFEAPAVHAVVPGPVFPSETQQGRAVSMELNGERRRVQATARALLVTNSSTTRYAYGFDGGSEGPIACSLSQPTQRHLAICLWEGYGFGTLGFIDVGRSGTIVNLLDFEIEGVENGLLGLTSDCIGRPYGSDGEAPQCYAPISERGILLFEGNAGDGVGSNLFLIDLRSERAILPASTSVVPSLGVSLRTTPSMPEGYSPHFDNKYHVAELPGADCYPWANPQSYSISNATNTIMVRGVVSVECIQPNDMTTVRTTEDPITWYFHLPV